MYLSIVGQCRRFLFVICVSKASFVSTDANMARYPAEDVSSNGIDPVQQLSS